MSHRKSGIRSATHLAFLITLAYLLSGTSHATLLTPTLVKTEIAPNSTIVVLPFFMDNINDVAFLKFDIPSVNTIASIESFWIFVDLFDDNDGGGEIGDIEFAQ